MKTVRERSGGCSPCPEATSDERNAGGLPAKGTQGSPSPQKAAAALGEVSAATSQVNKSGGVGEIVSFPVYGLDSQTYSRFYTPTQASAGGKDKTPPSEILRAVASLCHHERKCGGETQIETHHQFPFKPQVSEFTASSHSFCLSPASPFLPLLQQPGTLSFEGPLEDPGSPLVIQPAPFPGQSPAERG